MVDFNPETHLLEEARKKAAEYLNIDLSEPKQQKRIEALTKLYKKFLEESDSRSYVYKDSIAICDRLMQIYEEQQTQLDDLRISSGPFSSMKVQLENIVYRFRSEISELEKKLSQNQKILRYLKNDEEKSQDDFACRKRLKEIEDKSWDNWLKLIDVSQELRNTVIGFENRKSLLKISKLYIDYHILANTEISKCFQSLKQEKKAGIQSFYEILSRYQLPVGKRIDFKMFMQKMIESKFSDSAEVKSILGEFLDTHRNQISVLINEVKEQYERDQKDVFSVMNHYKQKLLNKQVLFTNESENMIIYFKRRYIEKVDLLCSRFQIFNCEMNAFNRGIREEKWKLFKNIVQEEFDTQINKLKIDYSKKAIPFLDNFWHLEQSMSQKYALDEIELNKKLKDLKVSKNSGTKALIESFKEDRDKLQAYFDKKLNLVENVDHLSIGEFDSYLSTLKEECDLLCSEIVNMNARFWTKINTEFNCTLRRYLIKLRSQYAPYLSSWKSDSKSWMEEHLHINLNQEFLRVMGDCLEGFSPEAFCYKKISKKLFILNERIRDIMIKRDLVESEQLLLMNSFPKPDYESLEVRAEEKMLEKEERFLKFKSSYNEFYSLIIAKVGEV